ncbi:hypothetical protein LKR43_15240, partial [Pusillimonas sp. MFBS29]|uniref:hypothetical protein n=1 Tax=Pusillimonas sp. MFBS29 TaxID=2886690 RepID=UPI001D1145B0
PLLPIPNRTVKRLRADDSGRTSVKVGHRQALIERKTPTQIRVGVFCFARRHQAYTQDLLLYLIVESCSMLYSLS